MLTIMSAEQMRKLMPNEKLDKLLKLIMTGATERAKNGYFSQTVGCPKGVYSKELIVQAKEFLENLGYKLHYSYSQYDVWFHIRWEE